MNYIEDEYDIKNKFFCVIYIFHLLSTPYGKIMLDKHPKLRATVLIKINRFSHENSETLVNYVSYLQHNFTHNPDSKYILKSKNKKYIVFLFKLVIKMFIMYRKSLAYTYMPGGKLFLEAQERFYETALLSK